MNEQQFFITSDQHFFHRNVIRYDDRPFKTIEDHDNTLRVLWNATVGKDDVVMFLGDMFQLSTREEHAKTDYELERRAEFIDSLNGTIMFRAGNHDYPLTHKLRHKFAQWSNHKNSPLTFDYKGYRFLLSHYPHNVEVPEGMILLHGHTHQKHPVTSYGKDSIINKVHIGVNSSNYMPLSMDQVVNTVEHYYTGMFDNEIERLNAINMSSISYNNAVSVLGNSYFAKD